MPLPLIQQETTDLGTTVDNAWNQFLASVRTDAGNALAGLGAQAGSTLANSVDPTGGHVVVPTNQTTLILIAIIVVLVILVARS